MAVKVIKVRSALARVHLVTAVLFQKTAFKKPDVIRHMLSSNTSSWTCLVYCFAVRELG